MNLRDIQKLDNEKIEYLYLNNIYFHSLVDTISRILFDNILTLSHIRDAVELGYKHFKELEWKDKN